MSYTRTLFFSTCCHLPLTVNQLCYSVAADCSAVLTVTALTVTVVSTVTIVAASTVTVLILFGR